MGTAIEPALLAFDVENPRIPFQDNLSQRAALLALVKDQDGAYLLALADDIASFGLSPAELPIVMPSPKKDGRYIVLDGNRRLTAIRALESPDAVSEAVRPGILDQLRKLSTKYQKSPITTVECVVVKDKTEAEHWIFLRHNGRSGGAGTVDWGAHEKARFRAKASGEIAADTRLLDFLEQGGYITSEERKRVPASNFRRLIETKAVLERLGIEVGADGSFTFHDEKSAIAGLLYITNDLASKATKVGDIYTKEQRKEYAESLPTDVVPIPSRSPSARSGAQATAAKSAPAKTPRVPLSRMKVQRWRLIPSECFLRVTDARIRRIEVELRSLDLKDYENAAAVLFRVFFELTADAYIARESLPGLKDPSLRAKLQQVANDLVAKNKVQEKQITAVRRACAKDSFLAPSVTLMHQWVHSQYLFPSAGDLRSYWDSLQPFFLAVWPR
jgi:hypothetical protein